MKKIKFGKFFIFVFSLACVVGCIFLAENISSVITVNGSIISENVSGTSYQIYAVSLGSYSTRSQAESYATTVKKKNGAGYIYKNDNVYHVLSSAYEIQNDAKLVVKNLEESGIQAEIISLDFNKLDFFSASSTTQAKLFIEKVSSLKTVYIKMYDISVSLDTSVIDETRAKIELIAIKSTVEESIQTLSKGSTLIDGIYYQMIKAQLDSVVETLTDLKDFDSEDFCLSAQIKFDYLKILEQTSSLIDLLNNES